MGFLGRLFGGGEISGGVRGTAQVVSATGYHEGVMANCTMQLVLTAEGIPPTAVEFRGLVHNKRWPRPGMALPASIDPSDPTRYSILWDEVERSDRRAQRSAEDMAAAMRGEGGGVAGPGGANVSVVNLSGGQLTEAQRAKLRMLGLDPGAVAGPPAEAAEPADDDALERLERLAALKASGALTEDEFAEQKRRILGA